MILRIFSLTIAIIFGATLAHADRIAFNHKPEIKQYRDPDADFASIETFSEIRVFKDGQDDQRLVFIEKHLLFLMRSSFELMGYQYVERADRSDIGISVAFDQVCREGAYKGDINDFGAALFGWLNPNQKSGSSNMQTRYNVLSNTKIGGICYPSIAIKIIDYRYEKMTWSAIGTTSTTTDDIRLAGNIFVLQLLSGFPEKNTSHNPEWYRLGFSMTVGMWDGNIYRPQVIKVWDGSPAQKAGIRTLDEIISLNGVSIENKSASEVRTIVQNLPQTECDIVFSRDGRAITKRFTPLKHP